MAKKEPDVVARMFAIQVELWLSGHEMSKEFYELFRRIAELIKPQAPTAVHFSPAAIASGYIFQDGFKNLRAQMNAAYVEACHTAGHDPANPGTTAQIGSSKGLLNNKFYKSLGFCYSSLACESMGERLWRAQYRRPNDAG
jgi:hypothetical protein